MAFGSFKQYVTEETGTVYYTFGRMNPPTAGHGKVMDMLAKKSGSSPYKVFLSQTQDSKKNPLSYSDKVKHVRKMFPKHARSVMINKKVNNPMDAASALYADGHINLVMVVGSDRVNEFDILLNKYNGVKARHGFYNFKTIKVISAGERDPDSSGVDGMSASKQRANASNNDFAAFSQGVPTTLSYKDGRKLFNDVRKGMGLKEETSFKHHIELDKVSDVREQYIKGDLYALGDRVKVIEDGSAGTVSWLGTNYLMIDLDEGGRARKWVDAVEPIEVTAESVVRDNTKQKAILERARHARAYGKRSKG